MRAAGRVILMIILPVTPKIPDDDQGRLMTIKRPRYENEDTGTWGERGVRITRLHYA